MDDRAPGRSSTYENHALFLIPPVGDASWQV
jgi:hypothetical protein